MNRTLQNFLLVLVPFYPFWAWISTSVLKTYINKIVILFLLPAALYLLISNYVSGKIKFPRYLWFFLLFTGFHLGSVFINHLVPITTNWYLFILSDVNVFAFLVFFIVENMKFDEDIINKMNISIFAVVTVSLIVAVIQIKFPYFFIGPIIKDNLTNMIHLQENRKFSIYSWIDMNSLGISFPILVSLLLSSQYEKIRFPIIVISGVIVSFLSRARYVMISALIVFSQLFFNSKIEFRKKAVILAVLVVSIGFVVGIARAYDFDIQKVINERILEKGNEMASAKARLTSLNVFQVKFPEHPWFGVGPSTRVDVLQLLKGIPVIHIGYLSYLYFYGVIGALFLFLTLFFLLRDSWRVGRKLAFWGSFYGILSFCFANVTMVDFNLSEIGIILAVIYLKYFKDKQVPETGTPVEIQPAES
jgi:hypothetical protein